MLDRASKTVCGTCSPFDPNKCGCGSANPHCGNPRCVGVDARESAARDTQQGPEITPSVAEVIANDPLCREKVAEVKASRADDASGADI